MPIIQVNRYINKHITPSSYLGIILQQELRVVKEDLQAHLEEKSSAERERGADRVSAKELLPSNP